MSAVSPLAIQLLTFAVVFGVAAILAVPCRKLFGLEDETAGRFVHLDGLRGIAALSVVACHVAQQTCVLAGFTGSPDVAVRLGSLGVQVFFALTAFLFTRRALAGRLEPASFYVGRARRILPLYLTAMTAAIVLALWLNRAEPIDIGQTLREIVDVYGYGFFGGAALNLHGQNMLLLVGVAWTLRSEWQFYLVLPLLFFVAQASRGAAALIVLAVLVAAVRDLTQYEIVWPFFLPGILAAYVAHYAPKPRPLVRQALTVAAVGLAGATFVLPGVYSWQQLIALTGLFLCLVFSDAAPLKLRPLRVLGLVSFSIYLLQYLVLWPISTKAAQLPSFHSLEMALVMGGFIVAVLVPLSCLSYRFIELPWLKPAVRRSGQEVRWPAFLQRLRQSQP